MSVAAAARPRSRSPMQWSSTDTDLTRPLLNELGEEDLDFPLGAVGGVRAVHDVLRDLQGVVAPDGAGQRLDRIGRAGERPERLDGPVALGHQRDQRPGSDEIDQFAKEWALGVLGVVRVRRLRLDCAHLKRDYLQAFALNSGNHVTDDVAADAVRLDQNEGALRHYCSLPCFSGSGMSLPGKGVRPRSGRVLAPTCGPARCR